MQVPTRRHLYLFNFLNRIMVMPCMQLDARNVYQGFLIGFVLGVIHYRAKHATETN